MSNFWDRMLDSDPQPQPQQTVNTVTPYSFYLPPTPEQQAVQTPKLPALAKGHLNMQSGGCPDCGSKYYGGQPGLAPHCFECGYNPRFTQVSQGGGGMPSTSGAPATPARQVVRGSYQPHTIVAHVTQV